MEIRKGEFIGIKKNGRFIVGRVSIVSPTLRAINPVSVNSRETIVISDGDKLYRFVNMDTSNQSDQSRRSDRKSRAQTEAELRALAICAKAQEHFPELAPYIATLPPSAIQEAKAFLQAELESFTTVDNRAFTYKARGIPEKLQRRGK